MDEGIEFCHRLRQEVGSYALMSGTGFEHTDFLQCCKFAEGDSRILMMKVGPGRYCSTRPSMHDIARHVLLRLTFQTHFLHGVWQ